MRPILPHGGYSLLVVFIATSGWMASLWEGDGCNYALVSGPIVDQLDPSYTSYNPITSLQFGFDSYREVLPPSSSSKSSTFWSSSQQQQQDYNYDDNYKSIAEGGSETTIDHQQETETGTTINANTNTNTSSVVADILLPNWSKNRTLGCTEYPSEVILGIMDSSWNTARTFAFLGLVLGGAGTSFLFCSICFVFSKVTWRWTGYELLLASLCQIVSLCTWFTTQLCSWNTCELSRGSKSDIAAVVLWTISGLMVVFNYPDTYKSSCCCCCFCCYNNNTNGHPHDHDNDQGDSDSDSDSIRYGNRSDQKKHGSKEIGHVDATNGIKDIEEDQIQMQLSGQSSGEEINLKHRNRRQHLHQKLSSDDDDDDNEVFGYDNNLNDDGRRYPQAKIT